MSIGNLQPFRIDVSRRRGQTRLTPHGDLDLLTTPQLEHQLELVRQLGHDRLVLDLRGLEFMDSSGLHLVLAWHERAHAEGIEFAVIQGSRNIERVFKLTGTLDRIPTQRG